MAFAIKPPLPPMEARTVEGIPAGKQWQYEPKWDGFRCIAFRDGDKVYLQSKSGLPLARYFPDMVTAIGESPARSFVLDGELAIPVGGKLSFDELQLRLHPAASRVQKLAHAARGNLASTKRIRLSPATSDLAVARKWFDKVGGDLDGLVAKQIDAAYASGKRTAAVKIKQIRTADCVVVWISLCERQKNSQFPAPRSIR